ncbi:MAG: multidrug efflux SMR transporter [Proteobacteria bacterium]|nr:multidrug efflux SMR transporter [Pseudomonadota bacterium]
MGYLFLAIAIVCEVAATTALKYCDGSPAPLPYLIVIFGYLSALLLLALAIRSVPVGIAYAIWAASGTLLVLLMAFIVHREAPDTPAVVGVSLIAAGVVMLQTSVMTVHD